MKKWLFTIGLLWCFSLSAQDSITMTNDTSVITLQFDSLPEFSFFNPEEVSNHKSRISELRILHPIKGYYFFVLLVYSIIMTWVFLNSKELVKSSVKSLQSLQHTVQFSRSDKQSNIFYFVIYALLFLIGFSLVGYFVGHKFLDLQLGFLKINLIVFGIFILDYVFTYFYLLFSKSIKTIELVQAVILNYAIILCLILWPVLFFITLASDSVGKLFAILLLGVVGIILLFKELRVFQVLSLEKINIFSFHFFAYLCTFKILPILVLIKILLR